MTSNAPDTSDTQPLFNELGLAESVLKAVDELGYETPSPIQARIIPHVLAGQDVLGQAQTGTGKTAAFALPLLSRLDLQSPRVQALVLVPTRELALQVAAAFQRYAAHLVGFRSLAIYGGQGYGEQLRALRQGVQVVVGTPGRVMDHMRKGTLDLANLQCLVLDEADEMLRMGFIDDVQWVLEQTPPTRQIALFSATMPTAVKRIAQRHMKNAAEIAIEVRTSTAPTIRQRYWRISGMPKGEALARILETEDTDGIIIFVRTKVETQQLADSLTAQGYAAAPLSGDIPQNLREQTVAKLKSGRIDILVATDVAARGLDVERISHVINYDIPYDTEAYVHRIGRTGRAGRSGEAILFVAPREARMLQAIERATRQRIEPMELPGVEAINTRRIARFKQAVDAALEHPQRAFFQQLLTDYTTEKGIPALDAAAALAALLQGDTPLLLTARAESARGPATQQPVSRDPEWRSHERSGRADTERPRPARRTDAPVQADGEMETFRVEVGLAHGVKPANLVGAIANEAGLDSQYIGRIKILDDYSTVDLPAGLPKVLLDTLKKVWVAGRPLDISRMGAGTKTLPVRVAVRPARITLPKDGKPAAPGKPRPAAVRKKPSKPS